MNQKHLAQLTRQIGRNKRGFKAYLFIMSAPVYLYHSLAAKDYWTLLFISCLALYAPLLWTAFGLYLCYKTHNQLQQNNIAEKECAQIEVIMALQKNRLDLIAQAIDENPDILYCDYQRRSIIAWCRYYKNTAAQELVMQMMLKYPQESMAA